jgi:choline-sulfatase
MAPSLLLPTEESRPYSPPLVKQAPRSGVEGAVSLEAQLPAGTNLSFSSTSPAANGNDRGTQGSANGNGFSAGQRPEHFITSQTLLEQSKNFASSNAGANGTAKKPNILYIMADQMAAPLLKMNNPDSVIKTPNLDKLAETGVVFSSAYCNSPLCAPSRFTMCSGQLPSKIGGYDNASVLNPDVPTYAHYLRREGYETVLAGKMHFIGPDQLHGFEHRYRSTMQASMTSLTLQTD